jgi:hypothetical protein
MQFVYVEHFIKTILKVREGGRGLLRFLGLTFLPVISKSAAFLGIIFSPI